MTITIYRDSSEQQRARRVVSAHVPEVVVGDQSGQLLAGHGPGQVEPLGPGAAQAAEDGELLLGLDALGGDLEAERVGHGHDRGDERGVVGVGAEPVDERSVDLHGVDREPLEVAERRVAGAEVVDRQVDAERLEVGEGLLEVVDVLHEHALGQLEAEVAGAHAGAIEDISDDRRRCRARAAGAPRG